MDLTKIKIGDKAPAEVNAVIEIPQGSSVKYEVDESTGKLEADRLIGSSLAYPFSYGFIPETLADDGDALDVLVITDGPADSGAVLLVRPVGILWMEDEHGQDEKILAVPVGDGDSKITDLDDFDLPTREAIKLFFKQYKEMEPDRWSQVENFGDKREALSAITKAMERHH